MSCIGDIIQCDYCGAWLQIEKSDEEQLALGSYGTAIYIECPNCGNMIMQGVFAS